MSINTINFITFSLLLFGVFFACERGDKNNVEDEEVSLLVEKPYLRDSLMIIGKWKLVNYTSVPDIPLTPEDAKPLIIDFSSHNIVYEFNTNGVLEVLGDIVDVDRFYKLLQFGDQTFFFESNDIIPRYGYAVYRLIISDNHFWYKISSEMLLLDAMVSGESLFTFVKVG